MNTENTTMDPVTACFIVEGIEEGVNEERYLAAWQSLIDTGLCWQLQGWYGRQAKALISAGHCRAAGQQGREAA